MLSCLDIVFDAVTSLADEGDNVAVINFRKIFDLAPHNILIKERELYKINMACIKGISCWLNDRSQKAIINSEM